MEYIFSPEATPAVPVKGSTALFPVRRIYCVGHNYGDHVREMGGDPKQQSPVFFSKPANAIVINNQAVAYPQATSNLHYEVELVVALASGGKDIGTEESLSCVFGYAVGIDLTKRDLQAAARKQGRPWDIAKGFDQSAPISSIITVIEASSPEQTRIALEVNGEIRQDASTAEMIWKVPEIICELSKFYELKAGDLIYTGTPSGVAAVNVGDHLQACIDDIGELEVDIV